MRRKDNWPELLGHYIDTKRAELFKWGVNDCALFVCDAVQLMTGVDLAQDFRGTYNSAIGATKQIRRACNGTTIADLAIWIAVIHEIPEVPILMAQRGDVGLVHVDGLGPALAIMGMDGMNFLAAGKDGIVSVPTSAAKKAWRI
jgi:hypothetical protein